MSAGLIRLLLLLVGLVCGVLAFGYFTQAPWALATWPWKDGPLANIFVSSVLAAVSAAMLWVAVSGHLAGAAGGFLHVSTMVGGIGLVLLGAAIDAGAGPGAPAVLWLPAARIAAHDGHAGIEAVILSGCRQRLCCADRTLGDC